MSHFNTVCLNLLFMLSLSPPLSLSFSYTYTIVPPEPPQLLAVDSSQTTSKSIFIRWNPPTESNSLISYYLINSSDHFDPTAEVVLTNTSTATTFFNVTGLLPGTTYELTVVAVSQGGDVIGKSEPSNSMTATTRTTGEIQYILTLL